MQRIAWILALVATACGGGGGNDDEPGDDSPDVTPPAWPPGSTVTATPLGPTTIGLAWTPATDDTGVVAYHVVMDGGDIATTGELAAEVGGLTTGVAHQFAIEASDATGNRSTDGPTTEAAAVPPDPSVVAPALDPTAPTSFEDANDFLYTGPDPIQIGVAPGTIDPARIAVVRGRVIDRDGGPVAGAHVAIHRRPDFGHTYSRADGGYDLAVNGGAPAVIEVMRDGYLPAQRQIDTPWRDYASVPDVVLVALDPAMTTVMAGSPVTQVARGTAQTDADGTRSATVMFPPDTAATMTLPDGTTQPLAMLSVRATEYTVGDRGLEAMPGTLPDTSAYTYAVELSVDEAIAAGATSVQFDRPVAFYLDNFIGVPVGTRVPAGWYDRERAAWVASRDGLTVGIVSITGGRADLDLDGDDLADDPATLGITDDERAELAAIHAPGTTLWRVAMDHFTPWDCNYPYGPPEGAKPPPPPPPGSQGPPPEPFCVEPGSVIACESQSLGESVAIAGTPYELHYESDRVPGRRDPWQLELHLTDATLPPYLDKILIEIDVAGQQRRESLLPAPDLDYTFDWDGRDGFGRTVVGSRPVSVRVGFQYRPQYYGSNRAAFENSFGRFFNEGTTDGTMPELIGSRDTARYIMWRTYTDVLGQLGTEGDALGGWMIDAHHAYDPVTRIVSQGDGQRRSADTMAPSGAIDRIAGNGTFADPPAFDGADAKQVAVGAPTAVVMAPDGTVVFATGSRVWRIRSDGTLGLVAGNGGFTPPYHDDGALATETPLGYVWNLAYGPDGSLYILHETEVCRLGIDGRLTRIIGRGTVQQSNGVLARDVGISTTFALAVGPDGTVYVGNGFGMVNRVGTDGYSTYLAGREADGCGLCMGNGDGGPAGAARLSGFLAGLEVGRDGAVYIADYYSRDIRRVGADGIITTFAGTGGGVETGDGGPASEASVGFLTGLVAAPDDGLLVSSSTGVRAIRADGIIARTIGNGTLGSSGDGGAALAAQVGSQNIALDPDGRVVIADFTGMSIRRVAPVGGGFTPGDRVLPSADGDQVLVFSPVGRHLRTVDATTGAIVAAFGYDSAGRLATITDGEGAVTTIQRDAVGAPTAIVAPNGATTALTTNGGRLASIADPLGNTTGLTYGTGGLLATLTDPAGGAHAFAYDDVGRLTDDDNAAGGGRALARAERPSGFTVTSTTAGGRVTTYDVDVTTTGDERRRRTSWSGAVTDLTIEPDGDMALVTDPSDGTRATVTLGPDPLWGLAAPVPAHADVETPAGLIWTVDVNGAVTLADPGNPLSVVARTDTGTYANGVLARDATRTGDAVAVVVTTPGGRTRRGAWSAGRLVELAMDDAAPLVLTHDAAGRVATASQDDRHLTYGHDTGGHVTAIEYATGEISHYAWDTADRLTSITMPGGGAYALDHDAADRLVGWTAPGGSVHALGWTGDDRLASYTAPGGATTTFAYDLDGLPVEDGLASGRTIARTYDATGRLATIVSPEETTTVAFAGATQFLASVARVPATGPAQTVAEQRDGGLVTRRTFTGAATGEYRFRYDATHQAVGITFDGEPERTHTRDADGHVIHDGAFAIGRAGPGGQVTSIDDGTLAATATYDASGRIETRSLVVAGVPIYVDGTTYDPRGLVAARMVTAGGTSAMLEYTHDADGQLATVTRDGATAEAYAYDARGNRVGRTVGPTTETAVFDAADRITALAGAPCTTDVDGYVTACGGATLVWGARGELSRATVGPSTITYAYDGYSRRVARTDAAGTIQYLYGDPDDDLRVTAVRAGGVVTHLSYDDAGRLYAMERAGARYYVATDLVGTPVVVADATGAVVKRVERDAFGGLVADTAPAFALPIGFGGGIDDPVTGLVRLGSRDYDPRSGRWTARDPLLLDGGQRNLYAYTNGDPLAHRDPTGLWSIGIDACWGICVGIKFAYKDGRFSRCGTIGVGFGGGVDFDPWADIDGTGMYTQAVVAVRTPFGQVGLDATLCTDGTYKIEPLFSKKGRKRPKLKAEAKVTANFCGEV